MPLPLITNDERRRRLASRHLLGPERGAVSVAEVADALVALHSSDPVSVYLSAAARLERPSIEAIDRALYTDREVFRHHAMRRTLWVMSGATVGPAHASCTAKIAATEKARVLGWLEATPSITEPRRWLETATDRIMEFLDNGDPASTREIGIALPEYAIPVPVGQGTRQETTIAAHSRVLLIAAMEGKVVRTRPEGSWVASNYVWDTADRWGLPDLTDADPARAAASLLRKVLDRFGPSTIDDLRWWTGWTLTMARQALKDLDATEVRLESGASGWVNPGDLDEEASPGPWVAMLPGLDPTTMGWKEREWFLPDDTSRHVFDRNGNAGPTVWVDGRVVGGWAQRADGEIAFDVHQNLSRQHQKLLDAATARLVEFVGETRFRVRFPPPNQKRLLS